MIRVVYAYSALKDHSSVDVDIAVVMDSVHCTWLVTDVFHTPLVTQAGDHPLVETVV